MGVSLKDVAAKHNISFDSYASFFSEIEYTYISKVHGDSFFAYWWENLLRYVPSAKFPFEYQFLVEEFKVLIESYEYLNEGITVDYVDYTLRDYMEKFGKMPSGRLTRRTKQLSQIVAEYDQFYFLHRFFHNQGQVFISESSKIYWSKKYIQRAAPNLIAKGILRRGTKDELPKVLTFKTKKELIQILENIGFHKGNLDKLKKKRKAEIIDVLIKSPGVNDLNLPHYFYFLSDQYQEFKEWLEREVLFFQLLAFLRDDVNSSYLHFHELMKDFNRFGEYQISLNLVRLFKHSKPIFGINENELQRIEKKLRHQTKIAMFHVK